MAENKNAKTPADDGQPVAWMHPKWISYTRAPAVSTTPIESWYPLYTAPQKREWQGLTGDEARKFYEKYTDREELIYAVDKFLEEKNNG